MGSESWGHAKASHFCAAEAEAHGGEHHHAAQRVDVQHGEVPEAAPGAEGPTPKRGAPGPGKRGLVFVALRLGG